MITWWLIEKPNVKSKWKNNLLSGYSVNSEKYFEDDFEEYLVRWDWIAQVCPKILHFLIILYNN